MFYSSLHLSILQALTEGRRGVPYGGVLCWGVAGMKAAATGKKGSF